VDRWHTISGFRGEKSRNNCIRIRDIAKSEMPMRVKALKVKLARVSEFRHIGIRESVKQVVRHRECRNRDRENPDRKRKGQR
jgi:hypothetical protein